VEGLKKEENEGLSVACGLLNDEELKKSLKALGMSHSAR
jgi:hypothetical protein